MIKLGALGDVVQAFGPLAAIRSHHSDAPLTVLTTSPFEELFRASGLADAIWLDRRPKLVQMGKLFELRRRLKSGQFRRVYDLQTSGRSSKYRQLFWPGPYPEWSGIAPGCSHPHANPDRDRQHTIERQAEQLAMAGISETPFPELSWAQADLSRFTITKPYAILVPGGAAHRSEKRWRADGYAAVARTLDDRGLSVLLVGTANEAELHKHILVGAPNARSLAGETSLLELLTITHGAALAVGNDSGPMHGASVAGVPSLVLYSHASDPDLCAQRGAKVKILRVPDLNALTSDEVIGALDVLGTAR